MNKHNHDGGQSPFEVYIPIGLLQCAFEFERLCNLSATAPSGEPRPEIGETIVYGDRDEAIRAGRSEFGNRFMLVSLTFCDILQGWKIMAEHSRLREIVVDGEKGPLYGRGIDAQGIRQAGSCLADGTAHLFIYNMPQQSEATPVDHLTKQRTIRSCCDSGVGYPHW